MSTGSTTFDPQQALSKHVLNNFYVGGERSNISPCPTGSSS
jgi:hypothetical protein